MTADLKTIPSSRITLQSVAREPFRVFFPLAVLAGIAGVALWPLHFWGFVEWYPGQTHARIMAYGLFGGFIFGFLGTAMPRMLSAYPLRIVEVIGLLVIYGAMVISLVFGNIAAGDALLVLFLCGFIVCLATRLRGRQDTPPPGFVLVGLSFLCILAGAILSLMQNDAEADLFWLNLQRLLSYQGFVLLPILGVGPFILPRFFGLQSTHDFPEALVPAATWTRKALLAAAVGVVIIGTFVLESAAWYRTAYAIRFLTVLGYLWLEMPFHRGPKRGNALGASIRISFVSMLAGFLAVAIFPVYRVALLHLTLVGGFAVITFVVATRVVFGHSGHLHKLKGRIRWVWISVAAMLLGMATRVSGDFWPAIMASHYNYGALLWIVGVCLWAAYVLPKVLIADGE